MKSIDIPSRSKKRLLDLPRQTLERFVRGAAGADGPVEDPHLLTSDYGAFVGLHRGKRLRGCVGTCFPTGPLYETVIDMTEAAASRDRRLAEIAPGELPHIRLDISVLGPLEPAADPLALPIGRRGVYVAGGGRGRGRVPPVAGGDGLG